MILVVKFVGIVALSGSRNFHEWLESLLHCLPPSVQNCFINALFDTITLAKLFRYDFFALSDNDF